MVLPEDAAIAVFDVLVSVCGATRRQRDEFLFHLTQRDTEEFRFGGTLGFGGKFWSNRGRVTCYPEDATRDRQQVINTANGQIAEIYEAFNIPLDTP